MNDIIKIIRSLEDLCVLIDGITETVTEQDQNWLKVTCFFIGNLVYFQKNLGKQANFPGVAPIFDDFYDYVLAFCFIHSY